MISKIMAHINNYFVYDYESGAYTIDSNSINGNFGNVYLAGMYVCIRNSFLNDGVYKILSATSTKITLDATLSAENTGNIVYLYSLKVPKDFESLVGEITTYATSELAGISSQSLGDLSISYTGDGSWQSVYSSKLTPYRKMYNDFESAGGIYGIRK